MTLLRRHLYRDLPVDARERKEADSKALATAEYLLERGDWESNMTVPEFVFSLMPLRHSSTTSRLRLVLDRIDAVAAKLAEHGDLLEKFRKQTLRYEYHWTFVCLLTCHAPRYSFAVLCSAVFPSGACNTWRTARRPRARGTFLSGTPSRQTRATC
jgi:hypothetical protein